VIREKFERVTQFCGELILEFSGRHSTTKMGFWVKILPLGSCLNYAQSIETTPSEIAPVEAWQKSGKS
jgi:hypothetical protein